MRPSDKKLASLNSGINSQEDYWYITKQECDFRNLCYIADILSKWDEKGGQNYEDFFNAVKQTEPYKNFLSPSTAHRATINLIPYGLKVDAKGYSPADLTPVFFKIKEITGGNYADKSLYQDIIDTQLEKILISTSNISLYPMMFTFKVLLTIGDVTGSYSVSIDEFKTFIATAAKWNEYFETVDAILRSRDDQEYRNSVTESKGKKVADASRYNRVVRNHSLISADGNTISIVPDKLNEVRMKVAKYETGGEGDVEEPETHSASATPTETLQQIFFGAPGVGKSHNLKTVYENEDDVVRITFHPETDYAAFVGCYKPQTEMKDDGTPEIVYKFQGQAFSEAYIEAWRRFVTDVPRKDQFLVIEEINRGNCAQIFGDIFQLLDRNEDGFSDYSIRPDKDLAQYLSDEFIRLSITEELNNIKKGLGDGKWMMMPPNLHILATMNTSDQSLFPIDSAFRRRWEWVYMPVETEPSYKGEPIKRFIETNDYSYDWSRFLTEVNKRIFSTTLSEDKQLGFWFIKPKGGKSAITANEFVSKVIFYLWNDIYKDFGEDATSIFNFAVDGNPDSKDKMRHTFRDFTPAFRQVNHDLLDSFLRNLGITPEKQPVRQDNPENAADPTEDSAE